MTAEYAFDLYPRDDPRDGLRLVRFTYEDLIAAEYRDVIGVGAGQATIWVEHAGAEHIDVRGEQYVRVVRLGGSEAVVGGLWTSKLPFETAIASERRHLTLSGPGQMAYIARARMAPHSYLDNTSVGVPGQDPFDGIVRLSLQGLMAGGNKLGAMLWRVLADFAGGYRSGATYTHIHSDTDDFGELFTDSHSDDRTVSRIPDLVLGFDQFEDSNGNAWTLASGDFSAQVGENALAVVQRLMQAGLSMWMDPDTFTLYAWEGRPATKLGRSTDRTGASWGASVVRFQSPTAGTTATGNILSETTRIVNAYLPQGPIWVGGDDVYYKETGSSDALYEGFIHSTVDDLAALAAIGSTQATAREEASDVGQVKHRLGSDPANGAYLPGEHYRVDELVRVDTGSGEWDYDEDDYPVGAWRVSLPEGGAEWEAYVDLGASYEEAREREFAVPPSAAHTHPPNPRLCEPDLNVNLFLGLGDGSLKASGVAVATGLDPEAPATLQKSRAVDGNDATRWSPPPSSGPTDDHYWAANLGSSQEARGFRLLYADTGGANLDLAIYGSNDPAAWAWLTDGSLVPGDPAANGWSAVYSDTNLALDTGDVTFTPSSYRYWLFHAESGGAGANDEFDIYEVELLTVGSGVSNRASRCDHSHVHNELLGRNRQDQHQALAITAADGSTVQEHIDDAAAHAVGSINVSHLLTDTPFPIIPHRGDMNPADGYPENTLPALRRAAQQAHGVEFDVIRSADGTWHIIHDTTVDRTTNGTGTVTALTNAYLAARVIDGGHGFRAPHAGLYGIPTLDEAIAVMLPYDPILYFDLKESTDAAHEALAQYIVDNGLVERSVLLGLTVSGLEAAHAIAPTLEMQIPAIIDDDPQNYDYIDRVLTEQAAVIDAAYVQAREPDPVDAYIDADLHYGEDETAIFSAMWERGVRAYLTNDLPNALLLRNEIVLGITAGGASALNDLSDVTITAAATGDMLRYNGTAWVDTPGRWEVVTNGVDVLVWDGANLLHEWTET